MGAASGAGAAWSFSFSARVMGGGAADATSCFSFAGPFSARGADERSSRRVSVRRAWFIMRSHKKLLQIASPVTRGDLGRWLVLCNQFRGVRRSRPRSAVWSNAQNQADDDDRRCPGDSDERFQPFRPQHLPERGAKAPLFGELAAHFLLQKSAGYRVNRPWLAGALTPLARIPRSKLSIGLSGSGGIAY